MSRNPILAVAVTAAVIAATAALPAPAITPDEACGDGTGAACAETFACTGYLLWLRCATLTTYYTGGPANGGGRGF